MNTSHPALGIVTSLAAELRDAGVGYCQWKSTTGLPEALLGHGDLDLLVDRADAQRFLEVAARCGFVPTTLRRSPDLPGLDHLHGLDEESGRLVHLHVHHRLVLGHDTTKNHRFPLERVFLDSAVTDGVVPVPPVELEYAVLVLRMVLKYASLDEVVWRGLRGRVAGPTPSERDELADLSARVDRAALDELVATEFRFLPTGTFAACEEAATGDVSLLHRLRVGRTLRAALDAYARYGTAEDAVRRVGRRLRIAALRRAGRMPRFGLDSGGALIAVVGGDGAGKSTLLDALEAWLADDFDVARVHLGRPPWSRTTVVVRAALKLAAIVAPTPEARRAPTIAEPEPQQGFARVRAVLWHVCTARDRAIVHRRARRLVNRGWLVLADRYPHENLVEMDVPQIRRTGAAGGETGLLDRLAQLEEAYHDRIGPPDLLVVLKLDPEIAVVRKTDEPAAYVHRRSTEVWTSDWDGGDTHVVDADRPVGAVADEVRRLLWSRLT